MTSEPMRQAEHASARYTLRDYRTAPAVDPEQRGLLLARCDAIADVIWDKSPTLLQESAPRLFRDDVGFVVVEAKREIVGFSIYYRLRVHGAAILYRSHTHLLPAHQGHGLYRRIAELVAEGEHHRLGDELLYCAWRTRNPVVSRFYTGLCARSAPDLEGPASDPALVELGQETAALLFPQLPLELPSMVMRNAYSPPDARPWSYRVQPHHHDMAFDRAFFRHLGDRSKHDAVFSIGLLRPGVSPPLPSAARPAPPAAEGF